VFQADQAVGEFSGARGFGQFFELDGLIERKFPNGQAGGLRFGVPNHIF